MTTTRRQKKKEREAAETTSDSADDEAPIPVKQHATRTRVKTVPYIPLPHTTRRQHSHSRSNADPVPPSSQDRNDDDAPQSHIATGTTRPNFGAAGRKRRLIPSASDAAPAEVPATENDNDGAAFGSHAVAESVSHNGAAFGSNSVAESASHSGRRDDSGDNEQVRPALTTSMSFAKMGCLCNPPSLEPPTTETSRPWVSRAANVKDVISSISPFVQSATARSISVPAPTTPHDAPHLQRSSSLRPCSGVTPALTRGEATLDLATQATPEVAGYRPATSPPPPHSRMQLKPREWLGPLAPRRLDGDPDERAAGKRSTSTSRSFLDNRRPRSRPSPHASDEEVAPNPFDHDLVDEDAVAVPFDRRNRDIGQEAHPLHQARGNRDSGNKSSGAEQGGPSRHDRRDNDAQGSSLAQEDGESPNDQWGNGDVINNPSSDEDEEAEHAGRSHEESGDDGSDDSFGKVERARVERRKREKDKELKRQAAQRADDEQQAQERPRKDKRAENSRPRTASSSRAVDATLTSDKPAAAKLKEKTLPKARAVTSAFDTSESTDNSSDDEQPAKGKQRARGRPPADALAKCDALGESTRAQAVAIADEYGMQLSTVMLRAGLGVKATKPQHIANAVKQVFAHEYRERHDGANAPNGAADAHYESWKADNQDDDDAHTAMLETARALSTEAALEGMTVNQLRSRALAIAKQITQLGKTYYNTENFMIVGAVLYLGDEFASSLFAADEDLLNKLLTSFKVAHNPRGFMNRAKVALQSRQIEIQDGSDAEDSIPPLTKDDFRRAPGVNIRDWVSKLIGQWLRQELSAHLTCKHFSWTAWQNTAFHNKLVLVGTDKHMPCQPGAMWVTRDKKSRSDVKQPALKQSHFLNLLKRVPSPFNKGKSKHAHYDLEEGSIPLRIITLAELSDLCPEIPHDPQPAVVSHDGEVLVFATNEHWQTDAAKRLCVVYKPIPLPEDKAPKMSKKKAGQAGGRTVTEPIDVDSDSEASSMAMPVRRDVSVAVSKSSRPGPSQRPATQRPADSHGDRPPGHAASARRATNIAAPRGDDANNIPYEMDSDPDPTFDRRELYPPPIRPREPVVFSPIKVPEMLLTRKRRRTERDAPIKEAARQGSSQRGIEDLSRGVKRKLADETPTIPDPGPLLEDEPTARLLPAFNDRRSPPRHGVSERRPPIARHPSHARSPTPRRVVSGDPWPSREVSHQLPDRLPPSSRARRPVRDISAAPPDRHPATYTQSQSYSREGSRAPSDRHRQYSRGPARAFARDDNCYVAYEMPTCMDYLQTDRRYRDEVISEDPREYEYAPRYYDRQDYVDHHGDRYAPGDEEQRY